MKFSLSLTKLMLECKILKEAAKFVRDFKYLANEADESLAMHKDLEFEIECLLRAVVSQDIMSIMLLKHPISRLSLNIERLQAQLGDLKGKCKDTPCVSDTLDSLSQNLENENVELEFQFLGTVRFGNDHVSAILGYGDLQWGNIFITRVYFIEGLGHNLFMVGQFGDSDLEVAFRRNTYFVKNLDGVDLLKGNRTINLHDMDSASPICFMAHATSTKSWLWHQRLSHLNFDIINDLARNDLVIGLPKFKYHKEHICPSYISFLHVFDALCYPKNDRKDIGKLDAKGDIGFFIGYSANSCAYRVYNRRTKKIIETMNVTFDELSTLAFEQSSLKPGLQSMTSRKISVGLDLTYAPSKITTQQPTERKLDSLFEAMYDDYIGGHPSHSLRTVPVAQAHQVLQTPTTSTTIADTAMTPTNSSSQATNFLNTSQDVDELETQQYYVSNAMLDGNTFVNPFATPSTSVAKSSSS
ncbi:integrase, catalytic region, zinc finger, CCHC-type containing protein [Tanacetum coccineum]|uniref:Integrase, catalytic region, zinc finger, CCHC-type containing protein n=1 Tax=Tanacetum coccineum TaxID=301880 RepID=A0ABQ5DH67_9ASTR